MADIRYPDSGRAIKTARKNAKPPITQEGLADCVGITRRHMIRLENGEHRPSVELRDRIADVCKVDKSELPAEDEEGPLRADVSPEKLFADLMEGIRFAMAKQTMDAADRRVMNEIMARAEKRSVA